MKEHPAEEHETDSPGNSTSDSNANAPSTVDLVSNSDIGGRAKVNSESPEAEIVDGELVVDAGNVEPSPELTKHRKIQNSRIETPVAQELEGIAANGGAVGAVVLGIWSILGSLLTHWSMVNGVLGLVLGVWGLTSKRPRLAWLGIILCLVGCALSMAYISEIIAAYFKSRGEMQ